MTEWWRRSRAWILALLVVAVAAWVVGRAGGGATPEELAGADSARAGAARLTAAQAAAAQLRAQLNALRAESIAAAAARVTPARQHTDQQITEVERLVPDTGAVRRAVDSVKASVAGERAKQDDLVRKLAADTAAKAAALVALAGERDAWHRHADSVQDRLDAALRERRAPTVMLGATGGPTCVWHDGRPVCGAVGASAGLTVRITLPLPRWLGGRR